jgi:hypothetical protein
MKTAFGVLALLPAIACAQMPWSDIEMQMPSPQELQAAYCIGIAIKAKPNLDAQLTRLRGFLLPRVPYLDGVGLMTATRQAEADMEADLDQLVTCSVTCHNKGGCRPNTCRSSEAMQARIQRCKALDFLPY